MISSPVAKGSSVPAWPTARSPRARRTRSTTSWDVGPAGLSISSPPIRPRRLPDAEAVHRHRQHLDDERHRDDEGQIHEGDVHAQAVGDRQIEGDQDRLHGHGAGILAGKATALGLRTRPWVKTSLAPGSQVVTEYLKAANLLEPLEKLGFHLVGYGCTTCIGNSGPVDEAIAGTIRDHNLVVAAVLSGNRNFEGRIHPQVKASYLASPPLVVAYALAGTADIDLTADPIGHDRSGEPVYLRDIWPSHAEIADAMSSIHPELFDRLYGGWSSLPEFQQTRGVLRLLAAVIHALWVRQDGSLAIMPGSVPIDDSTVQFELTRYLPANWAPVIDRDIDGSNSAAALQLFEISSRLDHTPSPSPAR